MSEENKKKKKNTLKRVFAANQVAGEIIKKRNGNSAIDEAVKTAEPFLRRGAAVGMSIGVAYAKKERENIKAFTQNDNRGKEVKPKEKEVNLISKESTSIKNAKNFTK